MKNKLFLPVFLALAWRPAAVAQKPRPPFRLLCWATIASTGRAG